MAGSDDGRAPNTVYVNLLIQSVRLKLNSYETKISDLYKRYKRENDKVTSDIGEYTNPDLIADTIERFDRLINGWYEFYRRCLLGVQTECRQLRFPTRPPQSRQSRIRVILHTVFGDFKFGTAFRVDLLQEELQCRVEEFSGKTKRSFGKISEGKSGPCASVRTDSRSCLR